MVKLVPLSEDEYRNWYDWLLEDYARDLSRAGMAEEQAHARSKADLEKGLSQGLQSKDQYLFSIQDEQSGERVGVLWYSLMSSETRKTVFIADILIYEQFRGRGYGKQAMLLAEDHGRDLGATRIGLHVFGHNTAAHALYKKLGYKETSIQMVKDL
jgi:RimJ/RimL family protein N-acetyltransferase